MERHNSATSARNAERSAGTGAMKLCTNVSNQPPMSPGKVVGRGLAIAHDESVRFKFVAILLHRREIPGIHGISIDARLCRARAGACTTVAVFTRATALMNKPAARFQRPPDASDDDVRLGHPMQSRIGKTASNSCAKGRDCPSMTRASNPSACAAATMAGLASTPTT